MIVASSAYRPASVVLLIPSKHIPSTLQAHWREPNPGILRALIDIGLALLPAFTSFPPVLLCRILTVFENDLLRPTLERLRALRALSPPEEHSQDAAPTNGAGMISIQVQSEDSRPSQPMHPSGAWKPWTTTAQTRKESLVSSSAPGQSQLLYRLASLIRPLIATLLTVKELPAAFVPITALQNQKLPDLAYQVLPGSRHRRGI